MKTYKISYFFDGNGEVLVNAKSKEEARELFFGGEVDFNQENEWGEQYNIGSIDEVDRLEIV
jgi:hypothetical protein